MDNWLQLYLRRKAHPNSELRHLHSAAKRLCKRMSITTLEELLKQYTQLDSRERFIALNLFRMSRYEPSIGILREEQVVASSELAGVASAALAMIGGDAIASQQLQLVHTACGPDVTARALSALSDMRDTTLWCEIASAAILIVEDVTQPISPRMSGIYAIESALRHFDPNEPIRIKCEATLRAISSDLSYEVRAACESVIKAYKR